MIYLCSTSPRRRALLKEKGIAYRLLKPRYHETPIRSRSITKGVKHHALGKALSVTGLVPNGLILGADTVVVFQNKAVGKPRNMKHAHEILTKLQGCTHSVVTAVALLKMKDSKIVKRAIFSVRSHVRLRKMGPSAIKDYFKRISPLDKAGAYAAQAVNAFPIVERITGSHSNVVGLPMEKLCDTMKQL